MSVSPLMKSTPEAPANSIKDELITPEMAHVYLGFNTHNRNLRANTVTSYAADIRDGNWQWNGESIKFAVDGALLDGQHRLSAIIEAGVPVRMLVIRGLPNRVQETLDGGVKRKFADVLNLRGEKHYVTLAATTRAVWTWSTGRRSLSGFAPTNTQLLDTLETYPWLREGMTTINKAASHAGLPAKVGGLCWWLFMNIDPEDTEYFYERLASDTEHSAGQPIYELRKTLDSSTSVRGERNSTFLLAITIKSWNKYRDGEPVGQLKYRAGGAKPEAFPEPR